MKGDALSEAEYSDCELYRYRLTRIWNDGGNRALFILLNPSTATEFQNDPTVERCERRAKAMGFGSFGVCNIFAMRSTDPSELGRVDDPIGVGNDCAILDCSRDAETIICGWGNHGAHLERGNQVERMLRNSGYKLHILELTGLGQPKHPLYISYRIRPTEWVALN